MLTLKQELTLPPFSYSLENIGNPEQILFLDIETTGFFVKASHLYLIGCIYIDHNIWHSIQWFAKSYEEEPNLLLAFFEFAKKFRYLIHYNGNNFDIPFLEKKCEQHNLSYTLENMEGIDLYRRISPYKSFLKLPNCKQKTVEAYLKIDREDVYSGGDLIEFYHDYVKSPSDSTLQLLLTHNREDLIGMVKILPILAYSDLFTQPLQIKKVQANHYRSIEGQIRKELLIHIRFKNAVPETLSCINNGCYFTVTERAGCIKVPILDTVLKYFYANYKDYYYLPHEDVALHKSVASFVDPSQRTQASAVTCYTRKEGSYLPQFTPLFTPVFKVDYKDNNLYFELTEELKKRPADFKLYATHLLQMLADTK